MEIYHRDHWIMVVHMATWKDVTIPNEENTIINWINLMVRIVKLAFLCLRAFRANAMRLKA